MSSIWMVVWPQVSPSSSFICCHFIAPSMTSVNKCCKYPVFPPSLSLFLWSNLWCFLHLCLFFFFQPVALVSSQTTAQGWTTGLTGAIFLPSSFVSRADRLKPCISSVSLTVRQEESGGNSALSCIQRIDHTDSVFSYMHVRLSKMHHEASKFCCP